jgi:hypothetical protein
MSARQRIVRAMVAISAVLCVLPAHAMAASAEESILMDDNHLVYASPSDVAHTMQRIAALGIDRVKVSVVWKIVAPDPGSTHRPKFDATDPNDYPRGAWDRYDLVVRLARALGMGVYFQLTPPAPAWAVSRGRPTQGYSWSQLPSAREYEQFVEAVGRRYSGAFVPPASDSPPSLLRLPVGLPGLPGSSRPKQRPAVPRVDYWGIWNEPNEGAWLNPQWRTRRGRRILVAPALYRGLVDAGWQGLAATGHAGDTVLIGETASRGWILPTPFVEALYCVSGSLHPLTGQSAADLGCPRSGSAAAFVSAHPGLLQATGYAHHPYSFDIPPDASPPIAGEVTLANLGGFERTVDRIFRVYGQSRAGGVPMYLTEWGYKTNPPNPFVHTSLNQQSTWLNHGEYMAFGDSHVRALAQFLLFDDQPRSYAARGTRAYWSTFQSGLLFSNGNPKPSYTSYRIPLWLPSPRHGSRVTVWGELRPADHTTLQYAVIEFEPKGSRTWSNLTEIQTESPEGFFVNHVSIPSAGRIRVAWLDPQGDAVYSRVAGVS